MSLSAAASATEAPVNTPAGTESGDLGAPLYVAWQVTNECNLACLHCIEESGPGKAFKDELGEAQVFSVLEQMLDHEVPYISFSGGEPMLHPLFFRMVDYVCTRGGELKIETNGHYLTPENCARMKALGVKAVQVSLDGASRATFNRMRVRGEFDVTVDGMRNLRAAGVPIEINFSPTKFNVQEIGACHRHGARAGRLQLLHRAHDVHRQRGEDLASGRALGVAVRDLLLGPACEDRAVQGAHARALSPDGTARGVALPRAAIRRRCSSCCPTDWSSSSMRCLSYAATCAGSRCPRSGPISSAPGRTRA